MSTRLMNIDIQVEHSLTLFYTRYRFRDSIIEKKKTYGYDTTIGKLFFHGISTNSRAWGIVIRIRLKKRNRKNAFMNR